MPVIGTDVLGTAEARRLAALARYEVLDSPAEASFDRITGLVRSVFGVPMAAVSLIDRDRQWFKSHPGLEASETPRNIAFCDHTIRAGAPLIVADAHADARFRANPLVTGAPFITSYAGVPLTSRDGFHVGTLCALDHAPRDYTATEIEILANLADIVVEELELRRIARYDHLTGVLSRRAFLAEVGRAIARRDRYDRPAALILFDLDHFKAVNDTADHAGGDAVLQAVAECCATMLRTNDMLGRVGGEEFGILLPELDGDAGLAAATRIREAITALVTPAGGGITASFGVAALARDVLTADDWLAQADAAMFAAKRAGRNCCRLAAGGPGARSAA
jgi:diguanylate cyclase (GGDEF)-like protein